MKSFEFSSPSELDKRFFEEQSLLSALSLEQMSTSRISNDTAADGSDAKLSIRNSLCLSLDPISPTLAFSTSGLNPQETEACYLAVPLQGKFSTPQVFLQKQKKASCFDQLYSDLTSTQMCWDVSLIKPESNSPKPSMESSALEQLWSPKLQSLPQPRAEISPWLHCSALPLPTKQRIFFWREVDFSCLLAPMHIIIVSKDLFLSCNVFNLLDALINWLDLFLQRWNVTNWLWLLFFLMFAIISQLLIKLMVRGIVKNPEHSSRILCHEVWFSVKIMFLQKKNEKFRPSMTGTCITQDSYLIELLELHKMEENVLQDAFCIPLIFIQLWCHSHNLSTFPYIKFKIIISAYKKSDEMLYS